MSLAFFISLFTAQHVSDVNTSILWSLRLICYFMGCIAQTTMQHQHTLTQSNTTHEISQQTSRKLLRMDVLTSETC